jgi:hypothetical protein
MDRDAGAPDESSFAEEVLCILGLDFEGIVLLHMSDCYTDSDAP